MGYKIAKVLKVLVFAVLFVLLGGFVVKELWNWLVPEIFGWKAITLVQAIGLLVLSKILFGGFHKHVGGRHGWKRGMDERWARMTPEERERFKAGMRGWKNCRFGGRGFEGPSEAGAEHSGR
jgi:hypothetical protein